MARNIERSRSRSPVARKAGAALVLVVVGFVVVHLVIGFVLTLITIVAVVAVVAAVIWALNTIL
jgi:hypothetical protein